MSGDDGSNHHIEEVIKQMAELADYQKHFIKDLPDYFRRVRIHLDRVKRIILLTKRSATKNYWIEGEELFRLMNKVIAEIDADKALINRKVYDEQDVEAKLEKDKDLTKDEENLTLTLHLYMMRSPSNYRARVLFYLLSNRQLHENDLVVLPNEHQ